MIDWNELSQYVGAQYRVVHADPDWLGVELSFVDAAVRIKLEPITAFDAPWVLISASICSERQLNALSALRYNSLVAVGSLVIEGEGCYLRAALPIEEISAPALDRTIDFIAWQSNKLRREFGGVAKVSASLFANFGD
jgi:hypothetical protein